MDVQKIGGSIYGNVRVFTLQQATAMIPLLESITQNISQTWAAIIVKRVELEAFEKLKADQAAIQKLKEELNWLIDKINGYIKEIEELGCFVEEFKRGIINITTLFNGRKVFFCWKLGETAVVYWHELDEGFNDRVTIKRTSDFFSEEVRL